MHVEGDRVRVARTAANVVRTTSTEEASTLWLRLFVLGSSKWQWADVSVEKGRAFGMWRSVGALVARYRVTAEMLPMSLFNGFRMQTYTANLIATAMLSVSEGLA